MANWVDNIDDFVDGILTEIVSTAQDILASGIVEIASAGISLYIVIYGYLVIVGKVQNAIPELIFTMVKWGLLLAFITNANGWLSLGQDAVLGLQSLGGAEGGLSFLSHKVDDLSDVVETLKNQASWYEVPLIVFLMGIGIFFTIIPTLVIILLTKVSLFVLFAISPIFFFCMMWGFLRESFNQWLAAILSNILVFVVFSLLSETLFGVMDKLSTSGNPTLAAMTFVLVSFFSASLNYYVYYLCNNLMKVSIDKLPNIGKSPMANPSKIGSSGGSIGSAGGVAGSTIAQGAKLATNATGVGAAVNTASTMAKVARVSSTAKGYLTNAPRQAMQDFARIKAWKK